MTELERPIKTVLRRWRLQRFLVVLIWSWGIGFLLVAGVFAVENVQALSVPGPHWLPFLALAVFGVLVAVVTAAASGPGRLDAALAIDRAFQLEERFSTAISLPDDLLRTPAGRALIDDVSRNVDHLDIASKFGLTLPQRSWLIVVPATLALILAMIPPLKFRKASTKESTEPLASKALTNQTSALVKKIASQRQELDPRKFPETERLLAEIQKQAEEIARTPPAEKDKLLVKLNTLSDAVKERQRQLGSAEQIKRQLQQLKELRSQGPVEEMARELSRGEFQKAAEKIQELSEDLASGKMNPDEKKMLEEQLGEMAEKLNRQANLLDRKSQLETANQNGALSEQEYQHEMEKLRAQAQRMQQLNDLAGTLSQAQDALKRRDDQNAVRQLEMSQAHLAEMRQKVEEMQTLDAALAEIADTKSGMLGEGGNKPGDSMSGMTGEQGKGSGSRSGLGRGQGQGERPETESPGSLVTQQVRQQINQGKTVVQGFASPGETVKGTSRSEIQREIDSGGGLDAGALSNQRIPKNIERHIRAYYDQINKTRPLSQGRD
jgi:hypothetical protein